MVTGSVNTAAEVVEVKSSGDRTEADQDQDPNEVQLSRSPVPEPEPEPVVEAPVEQEPDLPNRSPIAIPVDPESDHEVVVSAAAEISSLGSDEPVQVSVQVSETQGQGFESSESSLPIQTENLDLCQVLPNPLEAPGSINVDAGHLEQDSLTLNEDPAEAEISGQGSASEFVDQDPVQTLEQAQIEASTEQDLEVVSEADSSKEDHQSIGEPDNDLDLEEKEGLGVPVSGVEPEPELDLDDDNQPVRSTPGGQENPESPIQVGLKFFDYIILRFLGGGWTGSTLPIPPPPSNSTTNTHWQ